MPIHPLSRCHLPLLTLLALTSTTQSAPKIFWASDPVRPNETIMLAGSDLAAPNTTVELSRLDDPNPTTPAALKVAQWTKIPTLQSTDQSLKFAVPADWKMGVYACRVNSNDAETEAVLINRPDPWWLQGDEGESATPGGWLAVMGKSLNFGQHSILRLEPEQGEPILLQPKSADCYALRFQLSPDTKPGQYTARIHNGLGGDAAWRIAGTIQIKPAPTIPPEIFSVLETAGPDAAKKMHDSLIKYNQPVDCTESILAAIKKAKDNNGGTVFFPAGRYTMKAPIVVPDHTVLKGEGEGVVTLWWGAGHFNLDGGGDQGRAKIEEPKPPQTLIYGADFSLENMSLYLPLEYQQGIVADKRLRMNHVRTRIDHYWLQQGRGNGTVVRMGRNGQLTDCDILAKGEAVVPGPYCLLSKNRIMSNKVNTPMGSARNVIIEDNQMVSMDPTAYQNIAGVGRNIYYAHNRHEALYAQQSDYSFTFDAGTGAYIGKAEAQATKITLADDPTFPKWAVEKSDLWNHSAVCILAGKGAGQWRDVTSHEGRNWEVDRPFDTLPDATSTLSIVPFNGRVLVIANRFEDANWVNAGYGTSIDVVYANNDIYRTANVMNYGVRTAEFFEPSWYVQYFDNNINEGLTGVGSNGDGRKDGRYTGPLTRFAIHRRQNISADNSGYLYMNGNIVDGIIEACTLHHPSSTIKIDAPATAILLRNNSFSEKAPIRYTGSGLKDALILPAPAESQK